MSVAGSLTKLVKGVSRFGGHLLKQKVRGIIVAALAFACGAGLVYSLKREAQPQQVAPTAAPANCSPAGIYSAPSPIAGYTPAYDEEEEYGTRELQEWKKRHSGAPLLLDYDSLSSPPKLSESKVLVLPSGQILALAGGDLHLLDANRRVMWNYNTPHDVNNFFYVEATGVVYITDNGNNLFVLDAATGRVLRNEPRGGRAWYGAMIPYGEDSCLIRDELGSYRMGYDGGPEPTQDGVTAWRGTRRLWHLDVPPDAELQVVGSKIYAVTKTRDRILLKELLVPRCGR